MARTGAQLLVDTIIANGSTIGFGVPGESYLAVLDALHDVGDAFRFIQTRHEGGAAFMAEGYGKLTGEPGLCFVTRGPGVTNASIGIHTAKQNSTPMICFVGQIDSAMRDREAFQEIDYRAVFGTMAKWTVEIDDAARVPELVSRAYAVAQSGRPGPVVVALPEDMLVEPSDARVRARVTPTRAAADKHAISQAMAMLNRAKQPLVLAGGGGWKSEGQRALQNFVENNDLPLAVAFRSGDLIDNNSPSYAGDAGVGCPPWLKEHISNADCILALNIRFGETITDGYTLFDPASFQTPLIHFHADHGEIGKIFTPDIGSVGDPNAVATALAAETALQAPWSGWTAKIHGDWHASIEAPAQSGDLDMASVMAHLRGVLPENTIIANGAGNFAIWPGRYLVYGPEMRVLGPQAGAMGAGIPAAIMARLVDPDRFVLCFAGDGDFQMTCQELGTALQHGADPVILVINNGMYGTIRMHQEREYPGRVSGTAIVNPGFATLAKAYGFYGERVEKTADFAAAFERARKAKGGAVLELIVDPQAITPRTTISALRAAHQT